MLEHVKCCKIVNVCENLIFDKISQPFYHVTSKSLLILIITNCLSEDS